MEVIHTCGKTLVLVGITDMTDAYTFLYEESLPRDMYKYNIPEAVAFIDNIHNGTVDVTIYKRRDTHRNKVRYTFDKEERLKVTDVLGPI